MDIKCAAFALVVLTVTLDFTETRGPLGATGLVDNPHVRHKRAPPSGGIIMTRDNVKLHSDLQKREKRSVEEADILHNHRKGVAPEVIMTRKKIRFHSELQNREMGSLKNTAVKLNENLASLLADKPHSSHKRSSPFVGVFTTRKKYPGRIVST